MKLLLSDFSVATPEQEGWEGTCRLFRLMLCERFSPPTTGHSREASAAAFYNEFGWPCLERIEQSSNGLREWIDIVTPARIRKSHTKRKGIVAGKARNGTEYGSYVEATSSDFHDFLKRLDQRYLQLKQRYSLELLRGVPARSVAEVRDHLGKETVEFQAEWWYFVTKDAGLYSGVVELFPGLSFEPKTKEWLERDLRAIQLYPDEQPPKYREFSEMMLLEESYVRADYPGLFASSKSDNENLKPGENKSSNKPLAKGGRPPSEKKRILLQHIVEECEGVPNLKPRIILDQLRSKGFVGDEISNKDVGNMMGELRKRGELPPK